MKDPPSLQVTPVPSHGLRAKYKSQLGWATPPLLRRRTCLELRHLYPPRKVDAPVEPIVDEP
jgi:hypothetical protein